VHVRVRVDPREDRSWLQAAPRVPTDNAHAHDAVGPERDTAGRRAGGGGGGARGAPPPPPPPHDAVGPERDSAENWSEAVKRLKPRMLQRLLDTHRCGPARRPGARSACSDRQARAAACSGRPCARAEPGNARAQARPSAHLLPHQV